MIHQEMRALHMQVWITICFRDICIVNIFHFMERSKNLKISCNVPHVKLGMYATDEMK